MFTSNVAIITLGLDYLYKRVEEEEIIKELFNCGAIKEGHFILSSGLHSAKYVQCAQLLKNPEKAKNIIGYLVEKIPEHIRSQINMVVSPAMGGVIVGYEVARQLGCEAIFCERVKGKFIFRRDFSIDSNTRILLVEDVVTTAKSSLEVLELIKKYKSQIMAEAALIDRSNNLADKQLPFQFIPLLKINIETYTDNNLPENLARIPVTQPGSRFL